MKLLKETITAVILTAGGFESYSVPPYMWYATHSIEGYELNGGCSPFANLASSHEEAEGFHKAIVSLGINNSWRRYNRRDTACLAIKWTGPSAEINGVDFLFFSGHGCGKGPFLGCSPAYSITNWIDIRFGGNLYLKWVQASACKWFVAQSLDGCNSGKSEFERWNDCFQGVHAVQGHRAGTYDWGVQPDSMSKDFWDRWVIWNNTIYNAWKYAQIHWVYEVAGNPGLQPATAAANSSYASELWSQAGDALAPSGMGWLGWATVGNPEY